MHAHAHNANLDFKVKLDRGRKSIASKSVMVEVVATALEEGMSIGEQICSASDIALCLDMVVRTVPKVIRNILHCYPYKIAHVQELLPGDLPRREAFFLEFLARMEVNNERPWNIL